MADNVAITPGSGAKAASREVSYSGETAQAQVVGLVTFAGADDAKTVADVGADNPLPVRLDLGPEGIISSNGSLQVDATQNNEQSAETLNAPNAILLGDEPVQMVGLHPSFPLPIDTATPMPIAGRDATGAQRQVSVEASGSLSLPDVKKFRFLIGPVGFGGTQTGRFAMIDTTGYNTIVINKLTSSTSNTITCYPTTSSDGMVWTYCGAYELANSSTTAGQTVNKVASFVGTTTIGNIYIVPVLSQYFSIEAFCNSGVMSFWVEVTLRNLQTSPVLPYQYSGTTNVNTVSFGSASNQWVQAGSNAGPAVGGATAVGSARIQNPMVDGGVDSSNIVRAKLLDTTGNTRVVGPLAAGTSLIGATNAAFAPELMGITDLEGKVQRATGDVRGRLAATLPDATAPAEEGIIDALNNVVRELKLLNARIADLPYWLGVGAAMPDDASSFRDDPTIFNQ